MLKHQLRSGGVQIYFPSVGLLSMEGGGLGGGQVILQIIIRLKLNKKCDEH